MDSREVFRAGEDAATSSVVASDVRFVANVSGKKNRLNLSKGKKWGALGLIGTLIIVLMIILGFAGSVSYMSTAMSDRMIEEMDTQYADAVESKKIMFQQALYQGEIPETTAAILKRKDVLTGYMDEQGDFVETNNNKDGELSLLLLDGSSVAVKAATTYGSMIAKANDGKPSGQLVPAKDFIAAVNSNTALYSAFNDATYSRAAYYYDEEARKVFQEIGTNRNNYTKGEALGVVMDRLVGEGSNINANSVMLVEKTRKNEETGKTEVYYEFEENGEQANSNTEAFVAEVAEKNTADTVLQSTMNTASVLNVADTVSKEQRSSLFFVTFMENVSKMKAGEGNTSQINEALNYLYEKQSSEIIDTKTGEVVELYGTPLDSPSLYAVMSGNKVNADLVKNYSSDRILKLTENQLGVESGASTIADTVASAKSSVTGSIGRLITSTAESASDYIMSLISPTVSSSLVDNSYETVKGINAGEFLVEGAINVGKKLAKRSGATGGDAAAALSYAKLNSTVLAMDADVDRMERSPFDITSKNTFLGSVVYNFAIGLRYSDSGSFLSGLGATIATIGKSFASVMPGAYADESEGYLTNFGDCETYSTIGVVGSEQCAEITTFDVSTLDDPFNDAGFIAFIEENTELDTSGNRVIKEGSYLAQFILYNDERITPLGVPDGGIIDSLRGNQDTVDFVSDILRMVEEFLDSTEEERRISSGAAFVNSPSNPDWQTYKYAQRYVSLARAAMVMKQYAGDSTAYNSLLYFEGAENPVVAFLSNYYMMAQK